MAQGAASEASLSPTLSGTRRPSMLAVGTVVWLASELMFFAGLFAAWFSLRALNEPDWPPPGVELETVRTAVATAVLIASSFTVHAATSAAEHGDRRRTVTMTLVTVLLGSVFLANQVVEYLQLDFTLTTDAYGSMFFVMTGFHGMHVLAGLVLLLTVLVAVTGRTRVGLAEPLTVTSYYWHFVDVVWVAMFLTIYVFA